MEFILMVKIQNCFSEITSRLELPKLRKKPLSETTRLMVSGKAADKVHNQNGYAAGLSPVVQELRLIYSTVMNAAVNLRGATKPSMIEVKKFPGNGYFFI